MVDTGTSPAVGQFGRGIMALEKAPKYLQSEIARIEGEIGGSGIERDTSDFLGLAKIETQRQLRIKIETARRV